MKRLGSLSGGLFGSRLLTRDQKNLLYAMTLFFIATGISSVFVNTFLYVAGSDADSTHTLSGITLVVVYNLFFFASACVFSGVSGMLVRIVPGLRMCAGLILNAALYFLLLLYREEVLSVTWLLGILGGAGIACYNIAYNAAVNDLTDGRGRDCYVGFQYIVTAVLGLVAPLGAGLVLGTTDGVRGYQSIFTVSLLLFIAATVMAAKLPRSARMRNKRGFVRILARSVSNSAFASAAVAEMLHGMHSGVVTFLAPVLLMTIGAPIQMIGVYVLVCAALGLAGGFVIRHVLSAAKDFRRLMLAAVTAAVSPLFLLAGINSMSIFAVGILTSATFAFFIEPSCMIYHRVVGALSDGPRRAADGNAVRDFYLNLGRMAGAAVLLIVSKEMMHIVYALIALGILQLAAPVLYGYADKKALRIVAQKQQAV